MEGVLTLTASFTLHPKKTWFASSKILSPCLISLFEYHDRKNFPFSVRYVPLSLKNWVFSGVSLYSPASSGKSHSGWPAFTAAALKSASRELWGSIYTAKKEDGVYSISSLAPTFGQKGPPAVN